MTDDEKKVANANEEFYRAFETLDLREMERVWAKEAYIQCGHPGWGILRGWEVVMESWQTIFENTPEIHFALKEVSIELRESLAWVTLYEKISSPVEGQMVTATVLTTNIFEHGTQGWKLILHHGSPVAQPPAQSAAPTLH